MPDSPFRSPATGRPPAGVDTTRASIARVHDASLGGKDNFEVDRQVLDAVLEIAPGMREVARRNRAWVRRVVRYLAGIVGVDQFLDAGAGLPALGNTHEIAQLVNPWARVVYLDNDPMCSAHGRVLMETNEDTIYLDGDLTDPAVLAPESAVWRYLDPSRPVALILGSVLHHLDDAADPAAIVARCARELSPGSFVAITHYWDPADGSADHDLAREVQRRFLEKGLGSGWYRTREEIVSYFGELDLVEPGVVALDEWWPSGPARSPVTSEERLILGGVGRKGDGPKGGSAAPVE
ncbi:SAM-dependent methyltransferase [Nocardia sp. NBC_00416]|uniref:SAM-dependent methyltransferase n=1 Tax=Nocardia sp. NBC_00416 TaxID=2975991 RepID=UPI002E1F362F